MPLLITPHISPLNIEALSADVGTYLPFMDSRLRHLTLKLSKPKTLCGRGPFSLSTLPKVDGVKKANGQDQR